MDLELNIAKSSDFETDLRAGGHIDFLYRIKAKRGTHLNTHFLSTPHRHNNYCNPSKSLNI